MLADNEIIKALENNRFAYDEYMNYVFEQTLSLINRQKAKIERLTINMNAFKLGLIREADGNKTARADAIKEFAEIVVRDYPEMEFYLHNLVKEMVGDDK